MAHMFYLTEADVRELLPIAECVGVMRRTFGALAQGRAQNQPRRRLILESGSALHSMAGAFTTISEPSSIPPTRVMARISTSCSTTRKPRTPLALMEANHLGQIRTGAASGYAADLLANPQADHAWASSDPVFRRRSQLDAIRSVRPIKQVRVWSRSEEKRRKFADECGATAVNSAEEAVRGAQIVTPLPTPRIPS